MTNIIKIVEVGPRDGLQNEPKTLTIQQKLELITRLIDSGLSHIEAGAFVSPKRIPQMADSLTLCQQLPQKNTIHYSALVPNLQGFDAALQAGLKEIAVFTAASETFNQKNIQCSIDESLERFRPVLSEAKKHKIKVRGYVSCVLGCPYEGIIAPQKVNDVAQKLLDLGCYEVSLGDTIGTGTPKSIETLLQAVSHIPMQQLAVHFHDTYGLALVNIKVAVDAGIRIIDSSVAGLGGCPYAPGASGNVATEDAVYLLESLGFKTGVNLNKLAQTGQWISSLLGRTSRSRVGLILTKE